MTKGDLPNVTFFKDARKQFSRVGFFGLIVLVGLALGSFAVLFAVSLANVALASVPGVPRSVTWFIDENSSYITEFIVYAIFVPLGLLVLRKRPRFVPERRPMNLLRIAQLTGIALGLSEVASILSDLAVDALWESTGSSMTSSDFMNSVFSDYTLVSILFIVVLGPIIEELIFRKIIIDHTIQYGEGLAIITSAIMFGLFHGNFSQILYATMFGLVMAYIYVRTGQIRYTIGIHIFNNGLSVLYDMAVDETISQGIVSAQVGSDFELLQQIFQSLGSGTTSAAAIICLVYLVLYYGLVVLGVASLWHIAHHLDMRPITTALPKGTRFRTAVGNPGMILYILGAVGEALAIFALYAAIGSGAYL